MPRNTKTASTVLTKDEFNALTEAKRRVLANNIAKDRTAGLSGDELRAKYGSWLSGPARVKLLRTFGHGSVVAKSYDTYRDGDTRKGTRHAREHGVNASQPVKPKRTRKATTAKPRTRKAAK